MLEVESDWFRSVFEKINAGMVITDTEGTFLRVNPASCRFLGYTEDELLALGLLDITHPDDRALVQRDFEEVLAGLRQAIDVEKRCIRKDGTIVWARATAALLRDEHANQPYCVAVMQDITERKRAEEALRESEAHYRAVAESAPNAFVGTDGTGRIITWNSTAQRIFQYTEEEVLGQTLTMIMPERYRQDCQEGIERYQHTGISRYLGKTMELHGLRRDGSEFPVEISVSSWKTDRGEFYHAIVRDITERKQAEEQLRSSSEQLRALAAHLLSVREEEGTRIAREIHDELSPALTALMMDLSWLAGRLTEDQHLLRDKIGSMSKLTGTTIQSVRKIATELRPGVLDDIGLAAAIEWQAQEFQARAGIRCEIDALPQTIILDPDQSTVIFRIFQEILTNVARHSGASKVNISLEEKTGNLILEVRDNGKGIAESEIFSPKSVGLLGMRERTLLFGGDVKISGAPGQGTVVTARIPLK